MGHTLRSRVCGLDKGTCPKHCTYQKNLNGPQNVHGPRERGAQVEAEAHGPPELRPQRPRYHVVGAARCKYVKREAAGYGPAADREHRPAGADGLVHGMGSPAARVETRA